MKIEFSDHALGQLKVRPVISKKMVIETINHPDKLIPSFKSRKLYQKSYNKQTLEVVTIQEDGTIVVITQYFLER